LAQETRCASLQWAVEASIFLFMSFLTMRMITFLLAYLACPGQARRVHTAAAWQASSATGSSPQVLARSRPVHMQDNAKRVLVLGGTGYLGSRICKEAVSRGFNVVGASRRGVNPQPNDKLLEQVQWEAVDAIDSDALKSLIERVDPDVLVHAVGLLFDIDSGLANLNLVVSGSGSTPGEKSTYDVITRQTAQNALGTLQGIARNPLKNPLGQRPRTFVFTSCAEAGWPDVSMGDTVEENFAPEWLKRYLAAKRAVESSMTSQSDVRELRYRPSLIWSWDKLDVLPVIPVFNIAAALGVPFVDKTVMVDTLAKSMVEGFATDEAGIKRVGDMERLAKQFETA